MVYLQSGDQRTLSLATSIEELSVISQESNIIQVGSADGFSPEVSLGYVPNTEFLRFIAQALFGVFLYGSDCPYMSDIPETENRADNSNWSSFVMNSQSLQYPRPANIYHRLFMIREINMTRRSVHENSPTMFPVTGGIRERPVDTPLSKIIHANVEVADVITGEELSFPWTLDSKPPPIAELLCGSRDYVIHQVRLLDLVAVRLREGFRIESIHASRRSGRSSEKIEVSLSMPWLPNVTIVYTIKVSFPITDSARKPLSAHGISDKPLRVEINVLAHHSFAIVFINVQSLEQLGPDKTSFHEKLLQLDTFIKGIAEADEATKIFSAFNSKQILAQAFPGGRSGEFLYSAARNSVPQYHSVPDLPSNYWQYLSQALLARPASLDEWKCALILRSTATQRNHGRSSICNSTEIPDASKARRQVATIYLSQFLTSWTSLILGKATYAKFVFETIGSEIPTGFCFIHLSWETESLVVLSMYTFSIGASMRRALTAELTECLGNIQHVSRSNDTSIKPVVVCQKPAHKLLVRYEQRQRPPSSPTQSMSPRDVNDRQHRSDSSPMSSLRASTDLQSMDQLGLTTNQSFESAFRLVTALSRPYLRLRRWVWFADIDVSLPIQATVLRRVQERAFQLIHHSKIADHFLLVAESPGCMTYYREIDITSGGGANRTCAVQFVLLWNPDALLFITELWVEPLILALDGHVSGEETYSEYYEKIIEFIGDQDQGLLERVLVFEYVQELRHGEILKRRVLNSNTSHLLQSAHDPNDRQIVPTQFYLPALLHDSSFVMCVYHVLSIDDGCDEDPAVNGIDLPSGIRSDYAECAPIPFGWCMSHALWGDVPSLGSLLDSRSITSLSSDCLDPSQLLTESCPIPLSVATSDITQAARSNAVLYGFLAESLFRASDVAIKWPLDAPSSAHSKHILQPDLFEIIRTAIQKRFARGSVFLIRSLAKSVFYIKYIDSNRLIVAVLHIYDPLLSSKATRKDFTDSGMAETHYFAITLFECSRPSKSSGTLSLAEFMSPSGCSTRTESTIPWNVVDLQCNEEGRFIRLPQGFFLASGGKCKLDEDASVPDRPSLSVSEAGSAITTTLPEPAHQTSQTHEHEMGTGRSPYTQQQLMSMTTLSREGRNFLTVVNESYSTAFSKSLFLSLMQGVRATEKDIVRAFRVFERTTLTIDVAPLLNILATMPEYNAATSTDEEDDLVDPLYRKILLRQFEPLAERSVSEFASQFLFFRPSRWQMPSTANDTPTLATPHANQSQGGPKNTGRRPITRIDTPELLQAYQSLVAVADTPLFVHIECRFKGSHTSISKHALHSLPRRYPVDPTNITDTSSFRETDSVRDFSPNDVSYLDDTSVGDAFSIAPSRTCTDYWEDMKRTAELCINCWTLKSLNTNSSPCDSNPDSQSPIDYEVTQPTGLETANLSHDMRNSVISLKNDIENLTRERILRCMLASDGSHPSASTLYSADSLIRIRHSGDGVELRGADTDLDAVLEADSVHLRVRVGFVDPGVCLGLFRSSITLFSCNQMDIHQIGQSYYMLDVYDQESDTDTRKYWAFIVPKLHEVHLYFYCAFLSVDERHEIVMHIESVITRCAARANRLKLLQDLKDTHMASEYLIQYTSADISDGDHLQSSAQQPPPVLIDSLTRDKFAVGHFACPLVFTHMFPLHWRVAISKAISVVIMSISPLAIYNRKNMFVYSTNNSVFYMKIQGLDSTTTTSPTQANADDYICSPSANFKPIVVSERIKSTDSTRLLSVGDASMNISTGGISTHRLADARSTPTQVNSPRPRQQDQSLCLLVYGVDQPGPEIAIEFVRMITSKLHSLTQNVLGTFLARNYSTKLTREDIEFVMPISKDIDPARTIYYQLPIELENPHLFMLLLRQGLLTFLHPFNGPDVSSLLIRHYERFFRQSVLDQHTKNAVNEIHVDDFSFIYNSVPSRLTTSLEMLIGDGIAAVCLTPISPDGNIMYPTHGVTKLQSTLHIDLDNFLPSIPETEELAMCWLGFKIAVQIWTRGSINVEALVNQISKQFKATSGDYAVESYFRSTDWIHLPPHENLPVVSVNPHIVHTQPVGPSIVPHLQQLLRLACHQKGLTPSVKYIAASSMVAGFSNLSTPDYMHADPTQEFPSTFDISDYDRPLAVLPKILHSATLSGNPVVQTFMVSTELPLNTVATGMLDVLQEEGLQLYLFSRDDLGGDLVYITSSLPHENFSEMLQQSYSSTQAYPRMHSDASIRVGQTAGTTTGMGQAQEYIIVAAASFACGGPAIYNNMCMSRSVDQSGSVSSAFRDRDRDHESLNSFPQSHHTHHSSGGEDVASQTSSTSESISSANRTSRFISELDEVFMFGDNFLPHFPIYEKRSSFIVVTMATESVNVFSYNWKKLESERVFLKTLKLLNLCKIHYQFQTRKLKYMGRHIEQNRIGVAEFGEKRYSTEEPAVRVTVNSVLSRPESRFRLLDFIYHIGSFDADNLQKQIVDFLELFFRYGKHTSSYGIYPSQEMSQVLQTIQLIHSASAPIFYSTHRSELQKNWEEIQRTTTRLDDPNILKMADQKHILSRINIEGQSLETVAWYKTMIHELLGDYVSYLEFLGMEKVSLDLASSLENSQHGGKFSIAPNFNINAPLGTQRDPSDVESELEKECTKMKTQTHIVSFSYDFHLRHFQEKLSTHARSLPFDLIPVLRSFVALNPRKARFSRNRIINGRYRLSKDESSSSLFKYILKNPQAYGFQPLMFDGTTTACWLTTSDISLYSPSLSQGTFGPRSTESRHLYTLILCTAPSSVQSLGNDGSLSSENGMSPSKDSGSSSSNSAASKSAIGETLSNPTTLNSAFQPPHFEIEYFLLIVDDGSKFPLLDIEKEKRIERLVGQAAKYFGRDSLWVQLLAATPLNAPNSGITGMTGMTGMTELRETQTPEWTRLFLEKTAVNSRPLAAVDSNIKNLLEDIRLPWTAILENMSVVYPKHVRTLPPCSLNGPLHVLVINPANTDHMLRFSIGLSAAQCISVEAFSLSREGVTDISEYTHIDDVFNSILFYLWSNSCFG
ncbi:hypothetical protein BASA60_000852 [Batrachochytrium salamandrivorans]|nr:hypothetical protein BASA60_000852 [Batrachochytrium salamandrivorans]